MHFNDFDLIELQADALCTFIGNKSTTIWLFATLEVSSGLWASSVLGRRSDRNARAVIEDVLCRGRVVGCSLIATDGFEYYVGAVGALSLRILVTLVAFPLPINRAELQTCWWPHKLRTAA